MDVRLPLSALVTAEAYHGVLEARSCPTVLKRDPNGYEIVWNGLEINRIEVNSRCYEVFEARWVT